jgi:O-methyltransferase involved in polyketide biosynthesis
LGEVSINAAAARAHFIEAQIRDAVASGIRQLVWLGPRNVQNVQERSESSERVELGVEVEVFRLEHLEVDAPRSGWGARTLLDRSLVRAARTLFVCDGLLDRTPTPQIQAILRTIGDSCFGSRLACVYLDGAVTRGNLSSGGSQKPRCAVPRLGGPTQLGLETRALPALLASAGLVLDADVGLSEYARRAWGDVPSDLRGYSCCRLAAAHVRAPALAEVTDDDDDAPLN